MVYGFELWKFWDFIIIFLNFIHCLKRSTGKGSERAQLWITGYLASPLHFSPLPHHFSYLTRLNNFGMVGTFLYAKEAPIHDSVWFHPPRVSPAAQQKPGFAEVSQFCQGSASEEFTLTCSRHKSLNASGHTGLFISEFFSPSGQVVKGNARILVLLPERDSGNTQSGFCTFCLVTGFPTGRKRFQKFP